MNREEAIFILNFNRLLKKTPTALITQIIKDDYTDISRSFNSSSGKFPAACCVENGILYV